MLMAAKSLSTLDDLDAISRTRSLSSSEVCRLERAVRRTAPKRARWYWTRSDDKRLTGYIKRGKKPKQIAGLMARSEQSIWTRMRRLKLSVTGKSKCPIALRGAK
jgi:hypothetical protein